MKNNSARAILALHLSVLLFGSAGVLGKALAATSLVLVFGRTLFAALSLLPILLMQRQLSLGGVPKTVILCGLLLAVHWLSFFASLKVAPVAFGLIGFASFPLFVAWLEPWWFKEKRLGRDWIAALAVVIGMAVMVSDAGLSADGLALHGDAVLGLLLGVMSGLSFALLALANRWQGEAIPPFKLAFLQNSVACLSLLPMVIFYDAVTHISLEVWWGLVLLGVVFTALSHGLFMFSLRHVSARFASLLTSLEPVYGIALAFFILNEAPSVRTMVGCLIVLLATTVATYWHSRVDFFEVNKKEI
ncbi:DMT family transporter [Undibacterium sp. RTI2.1]|uniref:DMT family transporter n=1 Tax=unclassified Undibacterium TaxID=2630295 RepID=UPI002B22EB9C|nr:MULTISPECIES: DMT family transporter [unclassified Undibacterium]MEB0030493.1 DMT family transporter [Undibacterium sp. RTI2.1]MEB0117007.1 DMT family transporter [Undibacterium sp. RTI2.2]